MRKPNTFCCDCKKPLYRRPHEFNIRNNFYCNICKRNHMNYFATIKAKNEYLRYIERWKNGEVNGLRGKYQISKHIIKYLFIKYDFKCCECGWNKINEYTGNIPLEVEHIDGNYLNNNENNLKLLCPNCHSLTPTYKGANRGKGRKKCQHSSVGQNG